MLLSLPRQRQLDLRQPVVMGILNVTPDSFSDGGKYHQLDAALYQAEQMLNDGAVILDVGGESTRPGAADVSEVDELQRVVPVIEALRQRFDCVISVDTSKAVVMSAAVQAGADIINDVRALQEPGALQVAVTAQLPVCLMHMQGAPRVMQHAPHYRDVVAEVTQFLLQRAAECQQAGVRKEHIILDPGFGFGKTIGQNYELLRQLEIFHILEAPLLVGLSRKSMVYKVLGVSPEEALTGTSVLHWAALEKGAQLLRVHDVAAARQVITLWQRMTTA